MIEEVMLTTVDNPFNPFEDFDNWFKYDIEKGYYSCSKLARLVKIQDGMTELEIAKATEDAIDELIAIDFFDIFKKVKASDYE